MKRFLFACLVPVTLSLALIRAPEQAASAPTPALDRSPTDLVLLEGGAKAITANYTSDTASLVDLEAGRVLGEVAVGDKPFDVAYVPQSKRALVTNCWGNSVSVLQVVPDGLKAVATVALGDEPRGICINRGGTKAYIALAGEASVAVLDLQTLQVTKHFEAGQEPWHVALTPDGSRLVVGNSRGRTVSVLDTQTGKASHTVRILGRNLRHIAVSPDGKYAYTPAITERGLGVTKDNIDRGWVVGNRLVRVPLGENGPREAITLDISGKAVGDVDGVAFSPDGKTLALTAGGTHELLLFRAQGLPFVSYGGPADHMEPELRNDPARFRRVKLGGRPLGLPWTANGKVVVANYLKNAVQVVSPDGTVAKTIALGGPTEPSLSRRGESLFYDADRSFGSWYSCGTCHTEGHTNGGMFDTLNDGGFGKPKKTLSLRGVSQTAPYTWHGWQKTLNGGIHESMVRSMQGPEPSSDDLQALEAFFATLEFRPSPHRNKDGTLTKAAERGRVVFGQKMCVSCHNGPAFAGTNVMSVGLEADDDKYKGFNPPPLRGVYNRAPFLHDGRADTLEEVLTEYHKPSQTSGKPDFTVQELADIVAYLKAL